MKSVVEEQLRSVKQRQKKKALLHYLFYRSVDGEAPELCRYKCMFISLGTLFLLLSGLLFAQVVAPTMRPKPLDVPVTQEEVADMPKTDVPTLEADVEVEEAEFGVISTHFIDPLGNAITSLDTPKISEVIGDVLRFDVPVPEEQVEIRAVNTGEAGEETEENTEETEQTEQVEEELQPVPTPRIPAPVQKPSVPFPNIPPPTTQQTPPIPTGNQVDLPLEEEEDIYKGGMVIHESKPKTSSSLVYSSSGVSNANSSVYKDSQGNSPTIVYQSSNQSTASTVYTDKSQNSASTIYSENNQNTASTVYSENNQNVASTIYSENSQNVASTVFKDKSQNQASTVYSSDISQSPVAVYSDGINSQTNTVYNRNDVSTSSASVYNRQNPSQPTISNPTIATPNLTDISGEATNLTPPSANFQAGDIISAKLITGISVPKGEQIPLVAVSENPTVRWLGTATYKSGNRVQITFKQIVVAGVLENIVAVGLSLDNTPGILATIQDTTPTAAQDVLRSSIGGLANYAEALANETTAVVSKDVVVQTKEAPSIDSFILGAAANTFRLPAEETAVVRLANVKSGSDILILYGVE